MKKLIAAFMLKKQKLMRIALLVMVAIIGLFIVLPRFGFGLNLRSVITRTYGGATEIVSVPIFQIATLQITFHETGVITDDRFLGPMRTSTRWVKFGYGARVKLGVDMETFPEPVVEEGVIRFRKSDVVVGKMTTEILTLYYIDSISAGARFPVPIHEREMLALNNYLRERIYSLAITGDRINDARENFIAQITNFYRAVGFEVEWL